MKQSQLVIGILSFCVTLLFVQFGFAGTVDSKLKKIINAENKSKVSQKMTMMRAQKQKDVYIIQFSNDAPLATYEGDVEGLAATSPKATKSKKLDAGAETSRQYRKYLAKKQDQVLVNIEAKTGNLPKILYRYDTVFNGVAVYLDADEAALISNMGGIKKITKDFERVLHSDQTQVLNYALPNKVANQETSDKVYYWVLLLVAGMSILGLIIIKRKKFAKKFSALMTGGLISVSLLIIGCQPPPQFTGGFAWIKAPMIWAGFGVNDGSSASGEGIVVGVIDTGINPYSPSFAEVGGDGYTHQNPKNQFFGVCDPANESYDPTFPCNNKLIGAWGFPSVNNGDPNDVDGHGSHTASTAAGNIIYDAVLTTQNGHTVIKTIAGVAPHANVIAYNGCCTLSALLASMDQAVKDGVDVINYSIGGDSSNPWADSDALAYLTAREAGIFVATSAGNSGPSAETVGSPGDAPWITTVAATTHHLGYMVALNSMTGGNSQPPSDLIGKGLTDAYGPQKIVFAGDFGNALCLEDQFSAPFNGEIVVCEHGSIPRASTGKNILKNGAGGLVLIEVTEGGGYGGIVSDNHSLPALHLTVNDGKLLKQWLNDGGSDHQAIIGATTVKIGDEYADVLANFSSRGANTPVPAIIKPDIAAPGKGIFAAYYQDFEPSGDAYNIIQGTSMASPQIAGAGALLSELRPDWTPAQIQSAMMTTSVVKNLVKDDGATPVDPFDVGGGRIDLVKTANAGLLLDESKENYLAADPNLGGDPKSLNLASLGDNKCLVTCTWQRTVTNPTSKTTRWKAKTSDRMTVEPNRFSLKPGASQELMISFNANGLEPDQWVFDQVILKERRNKAPKVHFPVAVAAKLSTLSNSLNISAFDNEGIETIQNVRAIEIVELQTSLFGFAKGNVTQHELVSDPTNGNAYDGFTDPADGAFFITIDVPANSKRLIAEITDSVSDDLDVFVGTGSIPSAASQVDFAATGGALEYINIDEPAEGTYWVLVQNWESGHTTPATFSLVTAVVDDQNQNNMTMVAPASQPAGNPFDIQIGWNMEMVEGDKWYGVFSLGSDVGLIDNLGTVKLDLVRSASSTLVGSMSISATSDTGSAIIEGVKAKEITDLQVNVYGLVQGDVSSTDLAPDPQSGSGATLFDGGFDAAVDGKFFVTFDVPNDAKRIVTKLNLGSHVTAIGQFADPNDPNELPNWDTNLFATLAASINLSYPAPGKYWIMVSNWSGLANTVNLTQAVVPGLNSGNMTVTAPTTQGAGIPFDVVVEWSQSMYPGEEWFGAFDLGTDPANQGDLGSVTVDLIRE